MNNPLLSIIIPAYNQPEKLANALQSIIVQNYRPIQVVISDDCSPDFNLKCVVDRVKHELDEDLDLVFVRQSKNLGMFDNFIACLELATGEFLMPSAHDNYLTDVTFLSRVVRWFLKFPDLTLYVANCWDNPEQGPMLDFNISDFFSNQEDVFVTEGIDFARVVGLKSWPGYIGWSQFLVVRKQIADEYRIFYPPYAVDKTIADALDLMPDNVMAYTCILSMLGKVALDKNIVGCVDSPPSSYSRQKKWGLVANEVNFWVYHNVLASFCWIPQKKAFEEVILTYIRHCTVSRINFKLIRYYGFSKPCFIYLIHVACSFLHHRSLFFKFIRFIPSPIRAKLKSMLNL